MINGKRLATFLLGLVAASSVVVRDVAAGQKTYEKVCKNCHGPTAKGMASYPQLIGHGSEYLQDRLTRYKAGEKIGPNSALMIPHAKKLSDDDIASVVAYITTKFE